MLTRYNVLPTHAERALALISSSSCGIGSVSIAWTIDSIANPHLSDEHGTISRSRVKHSGRTTREMPNAAFRQGNGLEALKDYYLARGHLLGIQDVSNLALTFENSNATTTPWTNSRVDMHQFAHKYNAVIGDLASRENVGIGATILPGRSQPHVYWQDVDGRRGRGPGSIS